MTMEIPTDYLELNEISYEQIREMISDELSLPEHTDTVE